MKKTRAITLRTYPFKEADRVAVFFTEEYGLLKGVARGSLKMKSKMAGALEPLTLAHLRFVEPHGKELVVITGCEADISLYHAMHDLAIAAAAGCIAEITMESTGAGNAEPDVFRLLELEIKALRIGISPRLCLHYYELFTLKLHGVLPPLTTVADPQARALMQEMLKTNLMEMPLPDSAVLNRLGLFLRRTIFNLFGRALRSYGFSDKLGALRHRKTG